SAGRAARVRGRAAPHRDPHPRRRRRPGAAPARPAVGERPVGRRRLAPDRRPPLLEVVRDARARQRPRGDGDARAVHGVDDGKRTRPVIAMLGRLVPSETERVRALLRRPALVPAELEEIRRLVVDHEGVEYARARAHAYARAAKADLEVFPPSEERETLALVA